MVQISADLTEDRVRARRRHILEAAAEAFRDRGFHATTMRDIAAKAGMTVGNLYYYFKNKDDLLAFCQEDALGRLLSLAKEVKRRDDAPDRALAELIRGHLECLNHDVPASLGHLEVAPTEGERGRRLASMRDRYERAVRGLVADGQKQGLFRAGDPKVAALAILGAVNWTVRWYSPRGNRSLDEIATAFADQLVGGLRAGDDG